LAAGCALVAEQRLSAPVEEMLTTLSKFSREGLPAGQRVAFEFPEILINSYLALSLKVNPRPGIPSASVRFLPGNRLTVEAKLDLDVVAPQMPKASRGGLQGVQPAKVDLHFQVNGSQVTLACDRFVLSDKTLAAPVAAGILRILGSMQPEKFDTTRPISLPYGLKRLSTSSGTIIADTVQ
jgi:hypothetical protein